MTAVIDRSRPPDILVVVLDCVRHDVLPGGLGRPSFDPALPTLSELYQESFSFPRALTPASWTLPAHAALLTGLYPWESGIGTRELRRLAPDQRTIPELLKPAGYRSACFSANPFINPATGLTQGFDFAAWGNWRGVYLRSGNPQRPPNVISGSDPRESSPKGIRGFQGGVSEWWPQLLSRYPPLLELVSRARSKVRRPGQVPEFFVAPWVETAL